jgi:DNA-directed RNA polymerase subunit RPC12/RpoP
MNEKKYSCVRCQTEILEATFKSNEMNCYKCKKKQRNDPEELKAQLFLNIIAGSIVCMLAYVRWGLIASIVGFLVGFYIGKLYNYIVVRYNLDE